jgi:cobalt-zinc-cadmium efflux system membrane fusion protein
MIGSRSLRIVLGIGVAMAGCRKAAEPSEASVTVTGDELVLEPGSPKVAYLSFDTVRARTEKTLAVLPAQVVMNEDHTVRVTSPVAGRIRSLDAVPGQNVKAGDPLAHIVSGDLAQATADLARADAALTQAQTAFVRAQDLLEHRVIAQKELDQARTELAQAEAEAVRARARVKQLGAAGTLPDGDFVLRAPIGGRIIDRSTNVGTEVRPDNGATLFTVSALDELWLRANVYQRDLPAIKRGARLVFTTDAVPGRRFTATVTYVSDALDPATRTATVRGALPNPDGSLKPEMYGQVALVAPARGGLTVPTAALVTQGSETVVFVQRAPGRYARQVVQVEEDDGTLATVASGLAAGDVVVTRGSILLASELSAGR